MIDTKIREAINAYCEELGLEPAESPILLDSASYDGAIVGITESNRIVYSLEAMIEELMSDNGWTYEEAVEWVEYNTLGAIPCRGDQAPIILSETRESLLDKFGPVPETSQPLEGVLPPEEAKPILESIDLDSDWLACLVAKKAAIAALDGAMKTAWAAGAAFGSTSGVELRLYAVPLENGSWVLDEYLAVTFYGGAKTFRRANKNSSGVNFQEIGRLVNGGYYAELDDVAEMNEKGYLIDISDDGTPSLRKPQKEVF